MMVTFFSSSGAYSRKKKTLKKDELEVKNYYEKVLQCRGFALFKKKKTASSDQSDDIYGDIIIL